MLVNKSRAVPKTQIAFLKNIVLRKLALQFIKKEIGLHIDGIIWREQKAFFYWNHPTYNSRHYVDFNK